MPHPKILLCLDTDPQPSVFDAVVAVDAGVDQLLRHGGVTPEDVRNLVYGAMFTRGPARSQEHGRVHRRVGRGGGRKAACQSAGVFFGPMRVSLMLDSNGSNTTAAAAVLCAEAREAGRQRCDRARGDGFGGSARGAAVGPRRRPRARRVAAVVQGAAGLR